MLARLFAEGNPPWRLKGAYALELKLQTARATKDVDLGLAAAPARSVGADRSADSLLDVLQAAAARDLSDFFVFLIGEPTLELDAPYGGARYPVEAALDGRTFAKFHLDVGIGDMQGEPAEVVTPRDWLGFAGIAAPAFPSISREEHFAEKLHAYTLPRTGQPNSRVKDLIDLVLLMETGALNPERLRNAVRDTFSRRGTHELPIVLEPPPTFW
ncbi:MAG: nucleotidyl transferase AbiEii/AbiGii toxin family protein [Verrucomicrobia bacterium]|nr:nucleotidyl transferase AbiEii/AbiGii toxin family protein [Verrucomicrobiota bacterium]